MPAPLFPLPRRCALTLLALSAAWASVFASEHDGPVGAKAAASAAEPARAAPKKKLMSVGAEAADALGPRDPMDMLRERLAQKLGAVRAPDAVSPNVLRVSSKPSAPVEPGTQPVAEAKRPAPQRSATRASVQAASPTHAAHWDYAGHGGPESWGRMKPEFSKCSTGTRQSPIDIRDGIRVELDPVQFDYQPSAFRVIDNGHTVQVNLAAGNSIEVMGRRYELVQFHFHRPSEERIDGKQFDMVVHLVHKDRDGRLAVVAVLLDRGSAQAVVQQVWNNLPLEKGEEIAARGLLNLGELLPTERRYFTYMGSLTTPPCSEGVLWMVMKQPVPISVEQIGIFARLYPMNARPLQSAAGRLIKESN